MTDMPLLQGSWARAWHNLSLSPPSGLFERLLAAYDEPHRHYHSRQHLTECLGHFEDNLSLATAPGEVELALWFHDAIYDLRGKNNEQRSADWALQALDSVGAAGDVQRRVYRLIMATRHDEEPTDADQRLLVDIDLAILGSSGARFREYDAQVREEYRWVPALIYRIERRRVLRRFLARPALYHTEAFRARYEQRARQNLLAALA